MTKGIVLFHCFHTHKASRPMYVYSVGRAISAANVSIDSLQPHNLTVAPRVLVPKVGNVHTVGCLVASSFVYFGDSASDGGAIYRIDPSQTPRDGDFDELTVQQPQVEGGFFSQFLVIHSLHNIGLDS
jgi:hypothetical protein